MKEYKLTDWLPTTKKEAELRGWNELDVIIFSGDAYVDHPSFGAAVIGRMLEAKGLKVAIIPQPNWRDDLRDFKKLGRPRLFFGVSAGCMDSMVNKYTANRRLRSEDAYTPDGRHDMRPEYPSIVYTQILKKLYPDVPVVLGGIEASLRRLTHYDYWEEKLRPSILVESGADLLIYGMGEKQTLEVANRLKNGEDIHLMHDINGTCYAVPVSETPLYGKECPSYENVLKSKKEYAVSVRIEQDEQDHIRGKLLKQRHGNMMLVQNPPMSPLTRDELDVVLNTISEQSRYNIMPPQGKINKPIIQFYIIKYLLSSKAILSINILLYIICSLYLLKIINFLISFLYLFNSYLFYQK